MSQEYHVRPFPLVSTEYLTGRSEPETPAHHVPRPPHLTPPALDTPASEHRDPTYHHPKTPLSRRELVTTRVEPPSHPVQNETYVSRYRVT